MRFKGDRVKLLREAYGVPAGAMGTVIEDHVAPWVELDEAHEGLCSMPPQGKKDKLGHYICMGHMDIELCEQVSDEMHSENQAEWRKCDGLPEEVAKEGRIDVCYGDDVEDMYYIAKDCLFEHVIDPKSVKWWRPTTSATETAYPAKPPTATLDKYFGVQETLNARGARYGDFTDNAAVSQRIKDAMMYDNTMWAKLNYVQREALTMIAQKIARILNGDPDYKDNWHDIQGYARLAEERCKSSD